MIYIEVEGTRWRRGVSRRRVSNIRGVVRFTRRFKVHAPIWAQVGSRNCFFLMNYKVFEDSRSPLGFSGVTLAAY